MRILIYPMGSAGDVHPHIGVGRALKARGHEVYIITNAYFEAVATGAGLGFRSIGTAEDFKKVTDDPNLWHPSKSFETLVNKALTPTYEPILEHARALHQPGNTIIVAGTLAFGARNAAELFDIPMVTVHLAPSLFLSRYRMPLIYGAPVPQWAPGWLKAVQWWGGSKVADGHILPGLNAYRRKLGLPPARDVIRNWWHAPKRVLGLFPEWFAKPQPDWPEQTRLTGFPMFDERGQREVPAELQQFLDAGDAPIVYTPGSAMAHGQKFFTTAVQASQALGRRAILLSQYPETIPARLPDTVRHFNYVPFSQVLPHAAALVYHGGIGTCAQALQAGIPHLLHHMAHDQKDNLSRVRDLGVGDGLTPDRFTPDRAAAMLDRLLSDADLKARAAAITSRFQPEEWLRQTCELIEDAGR